MWSEKTTRCNYKCGPVCQDWRTNSIIQWRTLWKASKKSMAKTMTYGLFSRRFVMVCIRWTSAAAVEAVDWKANWSLKINCNPSTVTHSKYEAYVWAHAISSVLPAGVDFKLQLIRTFQTVRTKKMCYVGSVMFAHAKQDLLSQLHVSSAQLELFL